MKTIAIKKSSKMMDHVLKLAKAEDVIVQTLEGDEFLVIAIDDFDREIVRQRANKELMAFLDKRFRAARREKGIPLQEVTKRLGLQSASKGTARSKARN
jgi:hypothetical protein